MKEATLLIDAKLKLGEGPVWHPGKETLFCVDIKGKVLCRYDADQSSLHKWDVGAEIGAAVPMTSGQFLLALQSGLSLLDLENGQVRHLIDVESELPNNRLNDGKCDPKGRFWVGSMDNFEVETSGKLFSFHNGELKTHQQNVGISNGIAWSQDHQTMFYIDTPSLCVMAFDYDLESGTISDGRPVVKVAEHLGYPDGMTIDNEGKLWIAHWGGSSIRRWDPDHGTLLTSVYVPAPHTTSCAFGGANYDTLYITSARKGLTDRQLEEYPLSGGIFSFKPEIGGFAPTLFDAD